ERLDLEMGPAEIERAIVAAMLDRYRSEGPAIIEGAPDAVRRIAEQLPVAVASSAHPDVIRAALEAMGLGSVFQAVASSDEVAEGKPAPDVFLLAADRLGVAPGRCLVVEDSLNGIRAARAAGMTAVLVPNRSIPPAEGAAELADATIESLSHLDPATLRLERGRSIGPAERASQEWRVDVSGQRPRASGRRAPRKDSRLPEAHRPAWSRALRHYAMRVAASVLVRAYLRLRLEGRERLPGGPAVYCFNHLSWVDPFILMAMLSLHPRLYFFGPKEDDMTVGSRNRLIAWTGSAIPYKPGKHDLLGVTRRVQAVFDAGGVLAIAGEGGIHVGERLVAPLSEGPAYFAARAGVPLVPLAINGTSWIAFGRRVRVRVGEPIGTDGQATSELVGALTGQLQAELERLVADAPEPQRPGRFGSWISDRFNDWGPGGRPTIRDAGRPGHGGRPG
ncbi:MAG TPA: HAD-IA family hydrolase, partial [Gemmatimonadales bacterium]|nr:HAD-IA family hydrolase [Gemmatimonadales bacterium]